MSRKHQPPMTRDLLAEDERGRQAAQIEFERPLLLEAGAGTGKTTTLIHRVLAWALGRGWIAAQEELTTDREGQALTPDRIAAKALEGVVAVTFTEAAAAEMAARVAEGLWRVAAGDDDQLPGFLAAEVPQVEGLPKERRAAALLGAIDHLTVSTIHAWCRGILANHAVDAGLHPDFGVDPTGRRTEAVAREVTEEVIRRAYAKADPEDPLMLLAVFGLGPQRISEAVTALAQRAVPASKLERDPLSQEALDLLYDQLATALDQMIEAVTPLAGQKGKALGPKVWTAARASRGALSEASSERMERAEHLAASLAAEWPDNLRKRIATWGKGRYNGTEAKDLGDDADELTVAAAHLEPLVTELRRLRPRLLDAARRALQPLLRETQSRLRSQGIAGFDSLLIDALDLLRQHRDVRRQIRRRLRQLLVDEFQDTDRVQCDLVRYLALDGDDNRPGLFLVGDPKQSIYGWRNADLGAYDAFSDRLLEAGGERYSLCRNFRSAPVILEEVDRVIRPVMLREPGLQPAFEPLIPSEQTRDQSGFRQQQWAPIEYWVTSLGGSRVNDPEGTEREAAAVAADIRRLHDECAVEWREFGILLRSGTRANTFESALREFDVPFSVSRDRQYYRRREVVDAAALVNAIVDPDDHVALLAFLRSAAAGVPDAALIPLWGRGFPQLVTELQRPTARRLLGIRQVLDEVAALLPTDLPGVERIGDWQASVGAAVESLARLRLDFAELPADRFVERLRRLTMIETSEAARYLGQFRVANLDRFFRNIEEALADSGGDVQAVLRALRRSLRDTKELDEPRPRDPTENAAQVLTVHSAKGLEFGHLYLVEAHAAGRGLDDRDLDLDERWASQETLEYTLFGSPTPDFHRVRQQRRRVDDAERVRTLYVALTRARERLVVVGRWRPDPEPRSPDACSSFVHLLYSRSDLPENLDQLHEQAVGRRIDHGAAHWLFLEDQERPQPVPQSDDDGPESSFVTRDERALVKLRRKAEAHMALPFGRAASADAAARLEQLADGARGEATGDASRSVAMAVGVAVHRMFETWSLDGAHEAELEQGRGRVATELETALPARDLPAARRRADELLARLAGGTLLERLRRIGPSVVGREVPILLPADDGAAGFVNGALDLIYEDPENGRLTIVDFKSDRVDDEQAIAERAAAYRPQEELYARAVHLAFGLDQPPATELWFLWPDRLWINP